MTYSAGIVLFNPDISRLKDNIESIIDQVDKLICIDNCSSNRNDIEILIEKYKKIIIIRNNENLGIARALNQIMERSSEMGFDWVYTLDQDSISPDNVIKGLSQHVRDGVGIVCTNFQNQNDNSLAFNDKNPISNVLECITSGSLTSVDAWKLVGGFDEWLFIDCVDYDFCYKLKINNLLVIRVNNLVIKHDVGSFKLRRFLFFKIKTYNHSSFRNYYITRNNIYMIRKYKKVINIPKRILYLIKFEITKIVFERNRIDTIKSMIKGYRDAKKRSIK